MRRAGWRLREELRQAAGVVAAWAALHVWGVFFHDLSTPLGAGLAPLIVAAQSWLGSGLFIVAHDAMHGSLAPGRPRLNTAIGSLALAWLFSNTVYALHYAHLHYRRGSKGGLQFSGKEQPDSGEMALPPTERLDF